ncbi:hypothetical protein [Leptolyngbya ohadii]|uniref:hypothetical protein n=1 Tax=Leptolyngbya ohadii TaxID=1962290 RepID=UPI0011799F34|nr:hypothetical protein [Leptolyngbya ohadii]
MNASSFTDRPGTDSLLGTPASFSLRKKDESFKIGTKSSYKRTDRIGDDEGRDFYEFKLNERSRIRIGVTNREFLFGPSLEIRLEKKGSSEKIRRTALGGATAVFDRRLSKGTYTLRVSSDGESVPYRLTYRRNSADDFDPFD